MAVGPSNKGSGKLKRTNIDPRIGGTRGDAGFAGKAGKSGLGVAPGNAIAEAKRAKNRTNIDPRIGGQKNDAGFSGKAKGLSAFGKAFSIALAKGPNTAFTFGGKKYKAVKKHEGKGPSASRVEDKSISAASSVKGKRDTTNTKKGSDADSGKKLIDTFFKTKTKTKAKKKPTNSGGQRLGQRKAGGMMKKAVGGIIRQKRKVGFSRDETPIGTFYKPVIKYEKISEKMKREIDVLKSSMKKEGVTANQKKELKKLIDAKKAGIKATKQSMFSRRPSSTIPTARGSQEDAKTRKETEGYQRAKKVLKVADQRIKRKAGGIMKAKDGTAVMKAFLGSFAVKQGIKTLTKNQKEMLMKMPQEKRSTILKKLKDANKPSINKNKLAVATAIPTAVVATAFRKDKKGKAKAKRKEDKVSQADIIGKGSKKGRMGGGMMKKYNQGGGMKKYNAGGFPDLSGDGKVTQKDVLMGRGVVKKRGGGIAIKGNNFKGTF